MNHLTNIMEGDWVRNCRIKNILLRGNRDRNWHGYFINYSSMPHAMIFF